MSNQLLEGVNLSLFPVFLFGDFDDPMVDEVSYVFQMGWLKPPTIVVVFCIYTLEK